MQVAKSSPAWSSGCAARMLAGASICTPEDPVSDARFRIQSLMNHYCFAIDRGDLEGFAALFEHGTLHIEGDPAGGATGRDAVLAMVRNVTLYDGKPQTKHVLTNVQIDVDEAAGTATAQSYVTVFQALPDFPLQPIFLGHYRDLFERTGANWRFRERRISPDLVGDLSRHRADLAEGM
jgi:hypothetical protein